MYHSCISNPSLNSPVAKTYIIGGLPLQNFIKPGEADPKVFDKKQPLEESISIFLKTAVFLSVLG